MKRWRELKSVLMRAKVCGWVSGGVAFPYLDTSASKECGLGKVSDWREISR